MKINAVFLRILMILKFVAELIGLIVTAGLAVTLLVVGDLTLLPAGTLEPFIVEGIEVTPAVIERFRMPFVIIMAIAAGALILAMISTLKVSKALKECAKGRPFSEESASALKAAGIMELLSGLVSVGGTVFAAMAFQKLDIHPVATAGSGATVNLVFLANAALMFMLSGVARYGNELERQSSYSAISQMKENSED